LIGLFPTTLSKRLWDVVFVIRFKRLLENLNGLVLYLKK
jgi:hypothetical protein